MLLKNGQKPLMTTGVMQRKPEKTAKPSTMWAYSIPKDTWETVFNFYSTMTTSIKSFLEGMKTRQGWPFWKNAPATTTSEPPAPAVRAVGVSQIGGRPNHEDNFLMDGQWLTPDIQAQMTNGLSVCAETSSSSRVQLYAVCDGMGGHQSGETASRMCIEQLHAAEPQLESCGSLDQAVALLQAAVAQAGQSICAAGSADAHLQGMGTTLVLAVLVDGQCAVLHAGDSRAYLFDGEKVYQLTRDHTEGQRMLDLGLLTRRELADFPARKNLIRYVGRQEPGYVLRADVSKADLRQGVLLLCSDGISDSLPDDRIAEILRSEGTLAAAGRQLVQQAAADPQSDNATVLLLSLRG